MGDKNHAAKGSKKNHKETRERLYDNSARLFTVHIVNVGGEESVDHATDVAGDAKHFHVIWKGSGSATYNWDVIASVTIRPVY